MQNSEHNASDWDEDDDHPGLTTDDGEGSSDGKPLRRQRRAPKPVTAERIRNKSLWYLERYATSADNLRQVLLRWALRAARHHGHDEAEVRRLIEAEIARLGEVRLLDDTRYAEGRVRSLMRAGASRRKTAMKLKEKGVEDDTIAHALNELDEEMDGDAERAAAIKLARKRRLGPWCQDPGKRAERRERDLAALARAGFAFDLALEIVDAADPEALEAGA